MCYPTSCSHLSLPTAQVRLTQSRTECMCSISFISPFHYFSLSAECRSTNIYRLCRAAVQTVRGVNSIRKVCEVKHLRRKGSGTPTHTELTVRRSAMTCVTLDDRHTETRLILPGGMERWCGCLTWAQTDTETTAGWRDGEGLCRPGAKTAWQRACQVSERQGVQCMGQDT